MRRRIIASVLTFLIALQAILVPFLLPRTAHATVPTWDWGVSGFPNPAWFAWSPRKEVGPDGLGVLSLDNIAWMLARFILHEFSQGIISWIRTGQDPFFGTGTGKSLFITNINDFLFDAADQAAAGFLSTYLGPETYNSLCTPFRLQVGLALGKGYGRGYDSFRSQARCTVTDIVENLEDFYQNFENGGWAAWFRTASYENNPWGLLTLSLETSLTHQRLGVSANLNDVIAGLGFPGLRRCKVGRWIDGGRVENPDPKEFENGNVTCEKYETVTPGRAIVDNLGGAYKTELDKLGAADEINEILAALFDELLSWLISGGSGSGGLYESRNLPPPNITTQCNDRIDNDGDGLIDLNDPDCTSASDPTEGGATIPPPPAGLAQCNDGLDNDGDNLIDFPQDPDCASATGTSEGSGAPPPVGGGPPPGP